MTGESTVGEAIDAILDDVNDLRREGHDVQILSMLVADVPGGLDLYVGIGVRVPPTLANIKIEFSVTT